MDTRDSHDSKLPARFTSSRLLPSELAEPTSEHSATPALNLRFVLRALKRFWWQILAIWAVGSAAGVTLVYSQIKPIYEASTLLKADPGVQNIFGIQFQANEAMGSFLETQVHLILSTNVLTDVEAKLADRNLEKIRKAPNGDVIAALRGSLGVGVVPGTNLIRVAMYSTDPSEAAIILDEIVTSFLRSLSSSNETLTRSQVESLKSYQKTLRRELDNQNELWKKLVAQSDVDPQIESKTAGAAGRSEPQSDADYKSIQQQLTATTLELIQAQALLNRRKADPKSPEDLRVRIVRQIEDRMSVDPELRAVHEEVRKAEGAYEATKRLTRNPQFDPATVRAGQRVAEARARYWEIRKMKEQAHREAVIASNDPDRALHEAMQRVDSLVAIRDGLKQELERARIERRGDSTSSVQIAQVVEERAYYRELLVLISKRIEQLEYEQLKSETKISRTDEKVRVPLNPVVDRRKKMATMIPVGLLGGLVGLALVVELRSGRVSHPDEIAPMVPVEVFSVPPLPMQRPSRNQEDQAALIEMFAQRLDHLRVALGIDSASGQEGRCVMITSAAVGEGKTTLSAQLGGRCASTGARTLLIDADLRRATLSRMLDAPEDQGLVGVLEGKVEVEAAIVNLDGAGSLFLLPAGTSGQDPSRLLRGPELGQLLERLRLDFELILIDTPPLLPVPDALTIGQWADGALFAARSNTTRHAFLGRASRLLASARIPLLGVVVNGVPIEAGYNDYTYRRRYAQAAAPSGNEPASSDARRVAGL